MSKELARCVLQHSNSTGTVRLLLYRLAEMTNDADGYAYPSIGTLMAELNLPRRSVRRAIKVAEEELNPQELAIERRPGVGFSYYRVLCPQPLLHPKGASAPPMPPEPKGASATPTKGASATGKGGVDDRRSVGERNGERVERDSRVDRRADNEPILGIRPTDKRHPVAKVLGGRYRYRAVTDAQWERLSEVVDNEYPSGTRKGRDPRAGWQWLADKLDAVPRDAGDPLRAFFATYNRELHQRRAVSS